MVEEIFSINWYAVTDLRPTPVRARIFGEYPTGPRRNISLDSGNLFIGIRRRISFGGELQGLSRAGGFTRAYPGNAATDRNYGRAFQTVV